jgi:hypothetical protein
VSSTDHEALLTKFGEQYRPGSITNKIVTQSRRNNKLNVIIAFTHTHQTSPFLPGFPNEISRFVSRFPFYVLFLQVAIVGAVIDGYMYGY